MKKLIMTLSGTRGIIGDNLSPEIALQIGMAFGSMVEAEKSIPSNPNPNQNPNPKPNQKPNPVVIVGGDTRTSHNMVKSAVMSGLMAVGVTVIDIGKVTTPTVQHMIREYDAMGGCVITASHNPIEWNGIKLMNSTGSFLDDKQYTVFEQYYRKKEFKLATWDTVGDIKVDDSATDKHIDIILKAIDVTSIQNANLNVLIDPNNGTGCIADPKLLKKLNVKYTLLNEEGNGKFSHQPEPTKENVTGIADKMSQKNTDPNRPYDIGFVQDPDGDRLVILDENGRFIGEDYSLAFCIDYVLQEDRSTNKRVVVNLSTSNIVEWVAKKHHATITYTKIGESNVTQAIKELRATVGGEGNGGIMYPKVGWGRDSLTGIVLALKHLAEKKKTVSEIVSEYPEYKMIREKFSVKNREEIEVFIEKIKEKFKTQEQNTQDGVKVMFKNAWVHVRPSNTEPIVRIFIEAPNQQEGIKLLDQVMELKRR